MSDQSYDKVRQQIKNLGLKHKGGGSYEKDGKYFGRVTKQGGQFILKKAGETKRKERIKISIKLLQLNSFLPPMNIFNGKSHNSFVM